MNGREREIRSHLSLLFVLLGVCKLDHYRRGAPLHRDAVVHRLDRNHRNLIKSIVSVLFLILDGLTCLLAKVTKAHPEKILLINKMFESESDSSNNLDYLC